MPKSLDRNCTIKSTSRNWIQWTQRYKNWKKCMTDNLVTVPCLQFCLHFLFAWFQLPWQVNLLMTLVSKQKRWGSYIFAFKYHQKETKFVVITTLFRSKLQIIQAYKYWHTFGVRGPHNGCITKSEVLETIPLGNASVPSGLHWACTWT